MREPLIRRLAHSAEEMERFGAELGRALPPLPGRLAILYLEGELGAGKTTLARGLIVGRGYKGLVRSPTFMLLERYALEGLTAIHIDLYRLSEPSDIQAVGFRDFALPEHLWLIEWPERGTGVLPPPDVRVALQVTSEGHLAEASAHSELGQAWLAALPSSGAG